VNSEAQTTGLCLAHEGEIHACIETISGGLPVYRYWNEEVVAHLHTGRSPACHGQFWILAQPRKQSERAFQTRVLRIQPLHGSKMRIRLAVLAGPHVHIRKSPVGIEYLLAVEPGLEYLLEVSLGAARVLKCARNSAFEKGWRSGTFGCTPKLKPIARVKKGSQP
jgi:hypothetical protein